MKRLLLLSTLFATHLCLAQSVLVIGDSHTAGPFGHKIHELLSTRFNQVVTLGHSSSAAYHWVVDKKVVFTGGKFHQLYFEKKQYKDPHPIDWREKATVPKLINVLNDNAYHQEWKQAVGENLKADVVVIALGANDARVVANTDGTIRPYGYKQRKDAIKDMIASIKQSGAKCIWIAPPDGYKKPAANQKAVYAYLKDAVGGECPIMSSNHYRTTGCDGYHFSCSSQRPKAYKWAQEAFEFIKLHI